MSTVQGPSRRYSKYWVWDYFSIKDNISTSVCDICDTKKGHKKNDNDIKEMTKHLSDMHPRNYGIIAKKKNKDWESLFERKECSTDTATSINIQCKLCDPNSNPYNMKLGIYVTRHMETHLENEHNVTESEWEILRNWRDTNLEDYYDLTEEQGSIKRTKSCKKCEDHEFQRSNLCIMLKHLIQYHDSEITFGLLPDKIRLPLDILPKGFNRNPSNDPVDPVDPVDLVDLVDPVDPEDPVDPVDPDVASSSNPEPSVKRRRPVFKSWMWDYFSIKNDAISMSVCDICGTERGHEKNKLDLDNMSEHLSTNHQDNYKIFIMKQKKDWESFFGRVKCSTHSTISINIKCKLCNSYKKELRIYIKSENMETHLEDEHNVTESEWERLRNWRDTNLNEKYYILTEEKGELIKRTEMCKKCRHKFERSNLCIMLNHIIQVHQSDIASGSDSPSDEDKLRLPLNILPKGFNRNPSNDPVDPVDPVDPANPVDPVDPVNPVDPDVVSSSNPKPSSSHRGPSSSGQSNPCKMRQETDSSMNIWQIKDAATTVNPHSPTSDLSDSSLRERASKRSKVSHNTSSDEDDK
ncbi:uncharacterized protein LOC112637472 [Camponotus floridanus]|uniref:uncharacterized protein LOC112637472 n=1 Tax=Camponotus floridanus TaxID=104421 RepID=UPI000DC6D045|nr:uncharacterized protein LOC112637472 [Camponotus floridanus]